MSRVALVTGGTSGIGLCTARALAAQGCRVYTISRRGGAPEGAITHLQADVTREDQPQRPSCSRRAASTSL